MKERGTYLKNFLPQSRPKSLSYPKKILPLKKRCRPRSRCLLNRRSRNAAMQDLLRKAQKVPTMKRAGRCYTLFPHFL